MMQMTPISNEIPLLETKLSVSTLESFVVTANSIKSFLFENAGRLVFFIGRRSEPAYDEQSLDVDAIVFDPDFIQSKKYSWAVLAYEKISQRGMLNSSPGPGNGYFDTVQILLEHIELISRKLQLSVKIDRSQYFPLIESVFPQMAGLTRGLYPAILYFIALRIINEGEKNKDSILKNDFWYVAVSPSKKTILAATLLIAATRNMFNSLRYGYEDSFKVVYQEFEKHWMGFYEHLQQLSQDPCGGFCPDIEICQIMKLLPDSEIYARRKEAARRVAGYFDKDPNVVVISIAKLPDRLKNTYVNNRAYNHARLLIEQASKNLNELMGDTLYEVTILKLPK